MNTRAVNTRKNGEHLISHNIKTQNNQVLLALQPEITKISQLEKFYEL